MHAWDWVFWSEQADIAWEKKDLKDLCNGVSARYGLWGHCVGEAWEY